MTYGNYNNYNNAAVNSLIQSYQQNGSTSSGGSSVGAGNFNFVAPLDLADLNSFIREVMGKEDSLLRQAALWTRRAANEMMIANDQNEFTEKMKGVVAGVAGAVGKFLLTEASAVYSGVSASTSFKSSMDSLDAQKQADAMTDLNPNDPNVTPKMMADQQATKANLLRQVKQDDALSKLQLQKGEAVSKAFDGAAGLFGGVFDSVDKLHGANASKLEANKARLKQVYDDATKSVQDGDANRDKLAKVFEELEHSKVVQMQSMKA